MQALLLEGLCPWVGRGEARVEVRVALSVLEKVAVLVAEGVVLWMTA